MSHLNCLASAEGETVPWVIAVCITFALIVAGIAQGKNRWGWPWFILALLLGPLALACLVMFCKKLTPITDPLPSKISSLSSVFPSIPLDADGFAPEGTPIPDEDDDEDSTHP